MPKKESPLQQLSTYLPEGSFEYVAKYLTEFKVHLTITRDRKGILGDYRNRLHDKNHRISVNGNLNKYSFLITLLHELGHMIAYEKYSTRIQPHGTEWKKEFGQILAGFISKKIFPGDIEREMEVVRMKEGIPLLQPVVDDLKNLGEKFGVVMEV